MSLTRLNRRSPAAWFAQIAEIHLASIHHGALPWFGRRFVSGLYRELTRASRAAVWVDSEGPRVMGFLAGCADVTECYRDVLASGAASLVPRALPVLGSAAALRKIPDVLFYPFRRGGKSPDGSKGPRAELLSIATIPEARGRGLGRLLVCAFEAALADWGVSSYCVMTNAAEEVSNAFYRALGFRDGGQMRHHSLTLQRYVKTLDPPSGARKTTGARDGTA